MELRFILQDEAGQPLETAILSLEQDSSHTIVAYGIAEEDGGIDLSVLPGSYVAVGRYLGCRELRENILIGTSTPPIFKLVLKNCGTDLPLLEVRERAPAMRVKGDTTVFKASEFSSGNERSLSELLGVLPGLSMDEQGQFSYLERPIQELRVEGKNVLNNQHQLAGSGLRAEFIDEVLVIENFREQEDLNTSDSGVLALDISIKEAFRNRWQGDISLSAGLPALAYNGMGNGIMVGNQSAAVLFGRANNNGQVLLSTADFIRLQPSLTEALAQANGDMSQIIPAALIDQQGISANQDELLAANWQRNREHNKLNISILAAQSRKERDVDFLWLFPSTDSLLLGSQQSRLPSYVQQLQLGWTRWQNKKWTLKTTASVLANQSPIRNEQLFFSPTAVPLLDRLNDQQLRAQGQISFQRQWSQKWRSEVVARGSYHQSDFQFHSNYNRPTDALALLQKDRQQESHLHLEWQQIYSHGNWEQQFFVQRQQTHLDYELEEPNRFFNEEAIAQRKIYTSQWETGLENRWEKGKTALSLRNSFPAFTADDGTGQKTLAPRWSPTLRLRYTMSRLHKIVFSGGRTYQAAAPLQLLGLARLSSLEQAQIYQLPPGTLFPSWQLSLNYISIGLASKSRFMLSSQWQFGQGVLGFSSRNIDRFWALEAGILPSQWSHRFRINWGRHLWQQTIKLDLSANRFDIKGFFPQLEGEPVPYSNSSSSWRVGIKTVAKKAINAELRTQYTHFRRSTPALSFLNITHRYQVNTGLIYELPHFSFRPSLGLQHFRNGQQRITIEDVGFELFWRPEEKSRLEYRLIGLDITHLQGVQDAFIIFENNILVTNTHQRVAGSLLLGIQYKL